MRDSDISPAKKVVSPTGGLHGGCLGNSPERHSWHGNCTEMAPKTAKMHDAAPGEGDLVV